MHIGNITAMLAAWLDGRAGHDAGMRGRMLLRIEDIDTPRVLPDADRWIMDDLAWLGLDWDGEPVYQSRRLDVYEEALAALRGMEFSSSAVSGFGNGDDDRGSDDREKRLPILWSTPVSVRARIFAPLPRRRKAMSSRSTPARAGG